MFLVSVDEVNGATPCVHVCRLFLVVSLINLVHCTPTVDVESRYCGNRHFVIDDNGLTLIFDKKFTDYLKSPKCTVYLQSADPDNYKLALFVEELFIPPGKKCLVKSDNYLQLLSTTGDRKNLCGIWPTHVLNNVGISSDNNWSYSTSPELVFSQGSLTFSSEDTFEMFYARVRIQPDVDSEANSMKKGGTIAAVVIIALVVLIVLIVVIYKMKRRRANILK